MGGKWPKSYVTDKLCQLCTVHSGAFCRAENFTECIGWNSLQSEAVLGATQALLQRPSGSVVVCIEVMLPLDALAVEHCWVHRRLLLFTLVQCWNCQKQAAQLLSARSSAGLVRSCLHGPLSQHACLCCRDAWSSAGIVRSRLHDTLPRDARASRPCCGLHAARAELNISRGLQLLDAHAPGTVSCLAKDSACLAHGHRCCQSLDAAYIRSVNTVLK